MMTARMKRATVLTLALCAVLVLPWAAQAQETTLGGTITDSTGGVLPGVTITATHVDTGNTFLGVSDERGEYRVGPLRPGIYTVTLELPGFATVTRDGLELLLGQRGAINFEMKPSTLEETVTVTAEAPLVDVSRTRMGGNIDRRQMEELPVLGRNWMDLSMLAPGAKTNHIDESPAQGLAGRTDSKSFHLNLDGQQVTNTVSSAGFGQPRYSRDLIAEFELVTNRFDATQGRSMLSHVNAITKSGTNAFVGSLSGYFRDDSLNAKDFIVGRVLPYSNQQVSGTFGGPIKRDRMHFFANHEYVREPQAFTFTTPWPRFNLNAFDDSVRKENMGGVRVDNQFSANQRLMTRYHGYTLDLPNDPRNTGGATRHPSASARTERVSYQVFGALTQVLKPTLIHELRGGYTRFRFRSEGVVPHSPTIQLRGLTLGEPTNYVQNIPQDVYQASSHWTLIRGRHDLKVGGEVLYSVTCLCPWEHIADGSINATGGPVPGNIEDIFPVWNDPSTWNLAALSPITLNVQASVGNYSWEDKKTIGAAYIQDDWRVTDNLTLNLGVRYDVSVGAKSEQHTFAPFLPEPRPTEKLNFQPRAGFAYSFDDRRTVVRGGFGKYFAELTQHQAYSLSITRHAAGVLLPNDGRPDFAANWWNGPKPTYQHALTYPNRNIIFQIPDRDYMSPYSWQTSIGMQRQLGETMSVQADYVYAGVRREFTPRNANLSYNPVSGANNSYLIVASRPYPEWGSVITQYSDARGNSHSIETAMTKRFSRRWQASATYVVGWLKNADGVPTGPCWTAAIGFGPCPSGFTVPPDLGGEYTYAEGDQRHRAVFNGIWQLPYAFQVSGLYFYGSGQRFSTSYGTDLRLTGPGSGGRLRPNGSIMPRNALVGRPLHRVDLRIQREFGLGGRRKIDGIFEVFNVFNHANYGAYTTVETNRNYGQPAQNTNVAYQPRMMQLGFRLTF